MPLQKNLEERLNQFPQGAAPSKTLYKILSILFSEKEAITPVNSIHRTVLMAIEKGKLPNLIFENQAFESYRAMAAVLSAILKLPPVKQIVASKQMKSRYLDKMISKFV